MSREVRTRTQSKPPQRVLNVNAATLAPNTGMKSRDRRDLGGLLSVALADSYALYLKTQGFHWNVAGPLFYSLHKLTEETVQRDGGCYRRARRAHTRYRLSRAGQLRSILGDDINHAGTRRTDCGKYD